MSPQTRQHSPVTPRGSHDWGKQLRDAIQERKKKEEKNWTRNINRKGGIWHFDLGKSL
jgi:hypothetical protein